MFFPLLPLLSSSSMGNAQEMVRQAKLLAEATASLINAIKREAEAETDPDARKKLLDAARALADATAFMVEAAKVAARNPHDEQAQENLRRAAEQLRAVTNAAASNAIKKKAIKKLEVAAKQAAAVSTQCIAAAQGAAASNRNEASQAQLINHCKAVAEQISSLVQRVRTSMSNPDSPSAQLGLINSSQAMIPVSVRNSCGLISHEYHYCPLPLQKFLQTYILHKNCVLGWACAPLPLFLYLTVH